MADINKLSELLAAATPGPWNHKRLPGYGEDQIEGADEFCICDVEFIMFASVGGYCESPKQRRPKPSEPDANAELIAMAPDLAAEVIRLRGALQRIADGNVPMDGELGDESGESVVKKWNRRVDLPVRVKPLVWVEAADSWQSDVYSITTSYGQGPERFFLSRGTKIIRWDDAAAPLKAAAQADHEARIRAALE